MRDIKFRAWDIWENKFVYFSIDDIDSIPQIGGERFKDVMQFTGLQDKNGKEIYEGDIIQHPLGEVIFCDSITYDSGGARHSGFYVKEWFEYVGDEWCDVSYHDSIDDGCEVVGNIYENPGLRQKKRK